MADLRIPVYASPQVGLRPLGAQYESRLTPRSAGLGEIGRGVQELGRAAMAFKEAFDRSAKAEAVKALAEFDGEVTAQFYDAENGALHKVGEDALPATDGALTNLAKWREQRARALSSDRARQYFAQQAEPAFQSLRRKGDVHIAQQQKVVLAANVDARKKAALNGIAHSYADPEERERLLAGVLDSIRDLHPSAEADEAAVAEFLGEFHGGALAGALAKGDVGFARQYLTEHRNALGASAPDWQAKVDAAVNERAALAAADDIIAAAVDPKTGVVDQAVIAASLRQIKDPGLRKATRQFLTENERDVVDAQAQRVDALYQGLRTHLLEKQTRRGWDQSALLELRDAGPTGRAKYNALIDEARDVAEKWKSKSVPPTHEQMLAMTQFEYAAAVHDPRIAAMSVSDFETAALRFLHPKDRERAKALWLKETGKAAAPGKLDPADKALLAQTARTAYGAAPKDWTTDQIRAFYRASEGVEEYVRTHPQAKPAEVEVEVQRWFLGGTVPGTGIFSDDETTLGEAAVSGTEFEPEWTDADRAQARSALEAGGEPSDEANVDRYLRLRAGLRAPPILPPPVEEEAAPEPALEAAGVVPPGFGEGFSLTKRPEPADYYTPERIAERERKADEEKDRRRAMRTPRNRKDAIAKLDAMGITGEARDAQLRAWGY